MPRNYWLACVGITGWNASESPAALRRITHLAVIALMVVRGSDLVLVALFVPLVISLASARSTGSRILGAGVIYWLGLISYSIYLIYGLVSELLIDPIKDIRARFYLPHAFSLARVVTMAQAWS